MGLIDRIKESGKKLALAGVLGSSLYLSGCLTTPQEAGRLFIKPIFTGDFDEWNKQGQMSQQGNNQGVNGQNSSLQGNGNYGNQQQVSTQNKPFSVIFSSFKSWTDLNGDGKGDYPQEFFGETNSYSINENIILHVNMQGKSTNLNATTFIPSHIKMKAQIVDSRTGDLKETQENDFTKYGKINSCTWPVVPKNLLNAGSYRVLWSFNILDVPNAPWCYLGSYDFSVNP